MGRIARFSYDAFVDAALQIVAERGPAAVTVAAIAGEVGAPVGSVYHRFLSRDILLAEAWLKVVSSFQAGFLQTLEKGGGLDAALYTPCWVRSHPAEARILLLYRRDELVSGEWPADLKEKTRALKRDLDERFRGYVARVFGKDGQKNLNRAVFAIVDLPYAAVIRSIRQGKKPPREVDVYIRQTYRTIMEMNG